MKVTDGTSTENNRQILVEMSQFYKTLYTTQSKNEEIREYLNNIKLERSLNDGQKQMLNKMPQTSEFRLVIKMMKVNKSPGYDGIPSEFYKTFWPDIEDIYANMVQDCFNNGSFPTSMNTGILTLIHKGDDKDDLKNYRPISLTNCDYKILAFVFAERMQKILSDIINTDQTGYIRGRYIGCNVRNIIDLYDYAESSDTGGAIISIDFEKAFDTIEHEFIYQTLRKLHFGEDFIRWIKVFYKNPVFRLKNNGWVSGSIKMTRGIRQGCPMSALLFVMAVEILATDIRNQNVINGIKFGGYDHKICQYADDATIFVKDLSSIDFVIKCINEFSKHAGPKLNLKKTKGIWLGQLKNLGLRMYGQILWTGNPVKCLGIYIGHNKLKCYKRNWEDKIENAEKVLKIWSRRNLSIFGKVKVIKTYALSKLIFPATMLAADDKSIKRLTVLFHSFIWGKKDRIKRSSLRNDLEHGGIAMTNVNNFFKSLKAGWIIRYLNLKGKWKAGFEHIASKLNLTIGYMLKMSYTDINKFNKINNFCKFYAEVFLAYSTCNQQKQFKCINVSEILNEPIWGNKMFTLSDKCLFFKEWVDSKILYVKDLINKQGILKTEKEIFDTIANKTQIVSQLYIFKNSVLRKLVAFDFSIAPYVKIYKKNKNAA